MNYIEAYEKFHSCYVFVAEQQGMGYELTDKIFNALEKQIQKKPRETRCALMCSSCGHKITEKGCIKSNRNYCKKCGQAIDWGVSE